MKQVKFTPDLMKLILRGEKHSTWRLFDDKDLSVGNELELVNSFDKQPFAKATITSVKEKLISEIDADDRVGHEPVGQGEELLKYYETLYKKPVSPHEIIKII